MVHGATEWNLQSNHVREWICGSSRCIGEQRWPGVRSASCIRIDAYFNAHAHSSDRPSKPVFDASDKLLTVPNHSCMTRTASGGKTSVSETDFD